MPTYPSHELISLVCIPDEVHLEILSFLPPTALLTYSRCCKHFKRVAEDFELWKGKFIQVLNEREAPPPRLCAPASVCNDTLYVFGGDVGQSDLNFIEGVKNDVWAFSFADKKWCEIGNNSSFPHLTEHSAVSYHDGIYLFGGSSGIATNDEYRNDLFLFNTINNEMTKIESKSHPPPRSAHSAVVYNHKMYVYGGWNGKKSCGDTYAFNFATNTWNHIATSGSIPTPRRAHGAVVHSHYMYVFGGYDGNYEPAYFNQMYRLDLNTYIWEKLPCFGEIPSGRSRIGMVCYQDKIYVLGGWDRAEYFADLYEFSIYAHEWRLHPSKFNEFVRGIGQHACALYKHWLVVFGGYSSKERSCTNKTYACSLSSY